MGMGSVLLISHDGLDQIENDPDFGKNLAKAINDLRSSKEDTISFSSGNHCNPAQVIGHSFHLNDPQFIVIEGGTGWVANGQRKPKWSHITWEMVKHYFTGVK